MDMVEPGLRSEFEGDDDSGLGVYAKTNSEGFISEQAARSEHQESVMRITSQTYWKLAVFRVAMVLLLGSHSTGVCHILETRKSC